jgi:hypothetical protein
MKTQLVISAAAIALASTIGAASAAEHSSSMSKSSEPSAMHSMAKPGLHLTKAQQKLAWRDIDRSSSTQSKPADFTPTVGATVPRGIVLKPVPATLGRQVSALKPYDYARLRHEVLIVNPTDKEVVDVIRQHS